MSAATAVELGVPLLNDDFGVHMPRYSGEAARLREGEVHRADIIADALAQQSMYVSLPQVDSVHVAEILEARAHLRKGEGLPRFRDEMFRMAADVRELLNQGSSLEEVCREAKFAAESRIGPALRELEREWKQHRVKIVVKVLGGTARLLYHVVKGYVLKDPTSIPAAGEAIADIIKAISRKLSGGPGVDFLLDLKSQFPRERKG